MIQSLPRPSPKRPLARSHLIALIETALALGENRYARQAALAWLSSYPGDLPVNLLHARSLVQDGLVRQAIPILENLVRVDPECLPAQELLGAIRKTRGIPTASDSDGCVVALGGSRSW